VEEAVESLRNQGRVIPSVVSFVVGPEIGGDHEWAAIYVLEDLDGRRYEEDPALAKLVSGLNSYTGSSAPGPHAR
jgi:hypothetical protein